MQLFQRSRKSRKGMQKVFATLIGLVSALAAVGIALTVAFLIMANGQDQIVATQGINESAAGGLTAAYNASVATQVATATFPAWLGIIVIALIGGLLLSIVYAYMKQGR